MIEDEYSQSNLGMLGTILFVEILKIVCKCLWANLLLNLGLFIDIHDKKNWSQMHMLPNIVEQIFAFFSPFNCKFVLVDLKKFKNI